jgi:hypothetical protein
MDESREYYWACPDINDAALQMRRVYEDPQLGEHLGAFAKRLILNKYSAEALQRRYTRRLSQLGWL